MEAKEDLVSFIDDDKLFQLGQNFLCQLYEGQLERDGIVIETYFDNYNISSIIKGLQDLERLDGSYSKKVFLNRNTLVNSFAFGGWLGELRMLTPHQDEFMYYLNHGIDFSPSKTPTSAQLDRFMLEMNIITTPKSIRSYGEKELTKFINRSRSLAPELFKAVNYIRKNPWQMRFLYLFDEAKLIVIHKEKKNYTKLCASLMFKQLNKSFNTIRPAKDRENNNFSDALVLVLLAEMLQDYKTGGKTLPLFYDSTLAFKKAIRLADLQSEFSYQTDGGNSYSIIRDQEFFILKSVFSPDEKLVSKLRGAYVNKDGKDGVTDVEILEDAFEKNNEFKRRIDNEDLINAYGEIKKELLVEISEYMEYQFIEKVWLSFLAKKEIKELIKETKESFEQFSDKKFKKKLNTKMIATKRLIRSNVQSMDLLKVLWPEINKATTQLKTQIESEYVDNINVVRDFGLMRFSLPHNLQRKVIEIVGESGLLSGREYLAHQAILSIIEAIEKGILNKDETHLTVGLACLWCLSKHDRILEYTDSLESKNYSILVIRGASILEQGAGGFDGIYDILYELEERYKRHKEYEVSIAMAYLGYRTWKAKGGRGFKSFKDGMVKRRKTSTVDRHILDTLKYSKHAYESLKSVRASAKLLHKYYATNNYIFYITSAGTNEDFDKIADIVEEFRDSKVFAQHYWHYRFYDTFSRYYYRKFMSEEDHELRREYMKLSKHYYHEAMKKNWIGDKMVLNFGEFLVDKFAHFLRQHGKE